MRLFALTFGGATSASTYYRILQYRQDLEQMGIEFAWAPAKSFEAFSSLRDYDVVLLQKTLLPGSRFNRARKIARRLVYDADDRIWLGQYRPHHWWTQKRLEWRISRIARESDLCLAANKVIAEDLKGFGGRVEVVPMTLRAADWPPRETAREELVVGWTGGPKSLRYLEELSPVLRQLQHRYPRLSLVTHSGADPGLRDLHYVHVPYSPGSASRVIRSFDVGLLPLPDTPFTRGKSPIKALQYLASKLAVVCSPVGATREIVVHEHNGLWAESPEEWFQALMSLVEDAASRERLARRGRIHFETHFEATRVAHGLADLLSRR